MRVNLYNYSSYSGGTGKAFREYSNAAQRLGYSVDEVTMDRLKAQHRLLYVGWFCLAVIEFLFVSLLFYHRTVKQSVNLFSFKPVLRRLRSEGEIHHVHWINNSFISVFKFNKLKSGSIITLHDEWMYSGCSHYRNHDSVVLYTDPRKGLLVLLRRYIEKAIQERKHALLARRDIVITVPSQWMKINLIKYVKCEEKNVQVVPNTIDFERFSGRNRDVLREKLGLVSGEFVVIYGAQNSQKNPIKGTEFVAELLERIKVVIPESKLKRIVLVTFGGIELNLPHIKVINLGYVKNMEMVYPLGDLTLVLSKLEAFGLVALESASCGTPVLAFNNSALPEVIYNASMGKTVAYGDIDGLIKELKLFLAMDYKGLEVLRSKSREASMAKFGPESFDKNYKTVLQLSLHKRSVEQ